MRGRIRAPEGRVRQPVAAVRRIECTMVDRINRGTSGPNNGMNTRKFMISVIVALFVILVASVLVVKSRQNTMMRGIAHPAPTSSTTPE